MQGNNQTIRNEKKKNVKTYRLTINEYRNKRRNEKRLGKLAGIVDNLKKEVDKAHRITRQIKKG